MRPTAGRSTDLTLPQPICTQLLCPLTNRGPKFAHKSLTSVAVKNTWSIIFTPSYMLSWCGTYSPGLPRLVLPLTAWAGCLISRVTLRRKHTAPSQSYVLNIASITFHRSRFVLYSVDNKSTAKFVGDFDYIRHNGKHTEMRRKAISSLCERVLTQT